jgi:hypothetical protein
MPSISVTWPRLEKMLVIDVWQWVIKLMPAYTDKYFEMKKWKAPETTLGARLGTNKAPNIPSDRKHSLL